MTSLAHEARVLSVAPVFDAYLAGKLLDEAGLLRAHNIREREASLVIGRLLQAGLITRFATWWRFSEPVRAFLLVSLQNDEAGLYVRLSRSLVKAMSNGSGEMFRAAVGDRGTDLTAAVLTLASATEDEPKAFADLVDELGVSSLQHRTGDVLAVSRLLAQAPPSSDRRRQMEFVSGLAKWQVGDRKDAVPHFVAVWQAGVEDQAYGIAAHLIAAWEQGRRKPERAYPFARDAVKALGRIGDRRGLSLSLSTLGRVERDLVDSKSELAGNLNPIETLNRAVTVAREISPRQTGIALGFLAGALQHARRWDEALEVAEEAERLIPTGDIELLPVLTLLGSLYRSVGRGQDGRRALLKGMRIAEDTEDHLQVAMMSNVLAGNERYAGLLDSAVKHARRSVEIGESLGNERHLSHAYNTLARVLLDAGSTRADLTESLAAAEKSRALLRKFGDTRGIAFIEETIARIQKKLESI
jgi:tetratricopeptide (TPR) repeat protein